MTRRKVDIREKEGETGEAGTYENGEKFRAANGNRKPREKKSGQKRSKV